MAEDIDDNVLVGTTTDGGTATIRTTVAGGGHIQHTTPADPTTGDAIRAASQADVAALGTALASILAELSGKIEPGDLAALATAARQDAAKGVLDAILAALAPVATAAAQGTGNASLAAIDGKLPAQVGGKVPVTDPTALPLPAGAATATLAAWARTVRLAGGRIVALGASARAAALAGGRTVATTPAGRTAHLEAA